MPEIWKRFHYYVGNAWRLLSSPWLQKTADINQCSTLFASSFGKPGWHHIRRTLEEFDDNPNLNFKDSSLYRFLKEFKPQSISDLIPGSTVKLPLFVYPWGTFKKGETASSKDAWQSRFCGPSSDDFIEEEFNRIIALYRKLRQTGYQPYKYPNSFINGTWLISKTGDKRFIVLQGNHRVAVLAHLGATALSVRPLPGNNWKIREEEAANWPLVKTNQCPLSHALEIFRLFFEENGNHIKKARE
ncbi:MAG: hypothetical protein PHX43_09225 [Alphaproteobacteria bacterium]|nr:hypothetical protein [Alphaproteobacteria bacterium]